MRIELELPAPIADELFAVAKARHCTPLMLAAELIHAEMAALRLPRVIPNVYDEVATGIRERDEQILATEENNDNQSAVSEVSPACEGARSIDSERRQENQESQTHPVA